MKNRNHVHKIKRHTYKNDETVYYCVDNCSFRVNSALSEGKVVKCWRCDKPFAMNSNSKRLAKPHCNECTKGAKPISLSDAMEIRIPHAHTMGRTASGTVIDPISALRNRIHAPIEPHTANDEGFDEETSESDDDLV